MAFPLGTALSLQGIVFVVGWVAGPSAVVLFSTYRTMTRFPFQMMGMISSSIWPELSRSLGAGNVAQARKLHRIAVSSSVWVVFVALAALFVLAKPILRLWTGGEIPFEPGVFLILAGVVLANSAWSTSSVVSLSVNRHQKIALTYLIGTTGALVLAVGLGQIGGLRGVAAALFVIDTAMLYPVLKGSMNLTEDKVSDFVRWVVIAPHRSFESALRRSR